MGQRKFFLLGGAPRGSRNSPNYPKIAFMSRFTPICWDIFHKLLLNSILKPIIAPLKLFFKLLWAWKWPKIGPKCPFSLFLGIIFGVFAKTSLRTVQTSTMDHSLKFQPKKFFLPCGAPSGSRNSSNYPKIAFLLRFTPICWDIFHKLPRNSILIAITVSLKLFFEKNASGWVMGPKMIQSWPKMPFFLIPQNYFLCFC